MSGDLEAAIARRLGFLGVEGEVADLRRLTGGASRESWSFRVGERRLVLQRQRPGADGSRIDMEASLLRAAHDAGVPVPPLVDSGGADSEIGAPYLLSEFVEAETIARKILRDDEFATARQRLTEQCGDALARVHTIDPASVVGLDDTDQVEQYRAVLDGFGDAIPVFEWAFRWLEANRPEPGPSTVVHGDFRLGNLMVGPDGLRAVVDWEIAHVGDPMEDLGWLCVRAWRFGGPKPVAGIGDYDELFTAYEAGSGRTLDREAVRWWEVLGTLKWGVMCLMQARSHLDGWVRSMELAAIGRRVCENEHDLLLLLAPDAVAAAASTPTPEHAPPVDLHGRPTAVEIVDAVRGWVVDHVRPATSGAVAFHTRVAENLLDTLERELVAGPAMRDAHQRRLDSVGVASEADLAAGIRDGSIEASDAVVATMAAAAVDRLRVANPKWLAG